jgi:hypothetical protein
MWRRGWKEGRVEQEYDGKMKGMERNTEERWEGDKGTQVYTRHAVGCSVGAYSSR